MEATIYETLQNDVCKYLSIPAFNHKWEVDKKKGSGFFYAQTYPHILHFFEEHQPLPEALELKVALVFSWNPKICEVTSARFKQEENELSALEGSIGKELKTKDILDVDIGRDIRELWRPVKKATSSSDSTSGVSVTKFLHFSFSHIFPMIDLKTMKRLGGATVNLNWYSIFLSAWRDLYKRRKASFDQISMAVDMPVARVLDIMIFTPTKRPTGQY